MGKKYLYSWKAFLVERIVLIVGVGLMVHIQFAVNDYSWYNWLVLPIFTAQLLTLFSVHAKVLQGKLIQYMSATAYCVFLAQFYCWDISRWLYDVLAIDRNAFRIIISALVCMVLAIVMHELIEKPAKRWLLGKYGK